MGSPVFSKVYIDTSYLLSGDTLVNNVHKLTNPPFCMVRSLKQKSASKSPCPSWCLTSYTSCNSGVSLFPFTCRCAFMCEHVCVCVRVCLCLCVCACRDESNSLDQSPVSLVRQGVPLDPELTDSTTSTSLLPLPISCALGLQADRPSHLSGI